MDYFSVELRHGENKQLWIARCETEAEAEQLAQDSAGSLPEATPDANKLAGKPPVELKPNTAMQWVP